MTAELDDLNARDRLISRVRYSEITPDEAEAHAKASGWPPFAYQPALPEFDPLKLSRWPIVMAIAWIAWRDLELTRQQCPEFRAECTHWIFREWREPVDGGKSFAARAGWFLERWSGANTATLALHDHFRQGENDSPSARQMSPREAQQELWQALSDGKLVAEALKNGEPVDIPQREWSYLKLYAENDQDVLKYDALDRLEAFSAVKLRRDDLLSLWPQLPVAAEIEAKRTWPIEPYMLAPISDQGNSGFVPLCAALQWIMTDSGKRGVMMDDVERWHESVRELWPLICDGQLELIGLQAGHAMTARIPGQSLTLVKVLQPLVSSIDDMLLNAPSHISCTPYIDEEHWQRDFNDKLFESGRSGPAWSHLQVRKSEILERWPRSVSTISAEQACYRWLLSAMRASPEQRPKSRIAFLADAKAQFAGLADRQFIRAWQRAINESGAKWSKSGRPKSNRGGN